MLQMQHLVVNDVVDGVLRDPGMVEDTAYHNGVVGWIVVAQAVTGTLVAPGQLRAGHESMEKTAVEVFEDRLQVVGTTLGGVEALVSTHLADKVGFAGDVVAGNVTAVTSRSFALYRSAVHLRQ